jgi:hypothetical protein
MAYRVQVRADADTAKRFGFRVGGPVQWVTIIKRPVRLVVAEKIANAFRVDNPNSIARVVRA